MDGKRRPFPVSTSSPADICIALSNGSSLGKVVPQFAKLFITSYSYAFMYPRVGAPPPLGLGTKACVVWEFVPSSEPQPLEGKVEV